jgi:folate-binding protein YgfZ
LAEGRDISHEIARIAAGEAVCCALDTFALYEVSGADSTEFLHGQVTADLKGLARGEAIAGAYCTAKGRVLATFFALKGEQGWTLVLPRSGAAVAMKRLSMYVLRAKVSIRDVSAALRVIGVANAAAATMAGGPSAGATIASAMAAAGIRELGSIALAPRHGLILVAAEAADAAMRGLVAAGYQPVAPPAWKWLDVAQGIAWIVEATQEAFTPHMLNLDLTGAVNFQKGCYPGQEIVARTEYRGEVKRRMVRAQVQTTEAPHAGQSVFAPDVGAQTAGTVVDAAPGPSGGWEVLVVMHKSSAQAGGVALGALDGPPLSLLPLPYALP